CLLEAGAARPRAPPPSTGEPPSRTCSAPTIARSPSASAAPVVTATALHPRPRRQRRARRAKALAARGMRGQQLRGIHETVGIEDAAEAEHEIQIRLGV